MEWAWIPITIWAAACQTVRTGLQKHLKGRLSTNGASFTRFVFGMPLAIVYLLVAAQISQAPIPAPNIEFIGWMVLGAVAQILATNLLILALSLRNFVVGTAYSKTEAIQAALFGVVLLGETINIYGVIAILLGTVGVMLISLKSSENKLQAFLLGWTERSALIGIASGGLFAISAIGFRAASLSLEAANIPLAAATTLAYATSLQTLLMLTYLALREPGQLGQVAAAWRPGILVGLTSAAGSAGWFTAMALQVAAYVRMLGLVEIVFTFLVSYLAFRERPSRPEIAGVLILLGGIALGLASR
jgi:drug/metabolite transporter (DMT)-like permease